MLLSALRQGMDFQTAVTMILVSVFVVFCTMPVHEFAHAWTANKLGDPTARYQGRLTLNPIAHVDPYGALMILLIGFGWAKPVPVNMRNFKKPKRDMAITGLAGPLSNLLMAFLFLIFLQINNLLGLSGAISGSLFSALYIFFYYAALINTSLAVFNLIPIPPLDGSRILNAILPDRIYYKVMQYENMIRVVLMMLLFVGFLGGPISWLTSMVLSGMNFVIGSVFKLFI